MAPAIKSAFEQGEKTFCFHGELLYEAKVLEVRRSDPDDNKSPVEYRVHYKGWKNTWDDWVSEDRLRKLSDDNRELAHSLRKEMLQTQARANAKEKALASASRKRNSTAVTVAMSDTSSQPDSDDSPAPVSRRRAAIITRDYDLEKETTFLSHPTIHIPLPDHLKSILVDDWEYITKSLSLVSVPSLTPVNAILDDYLVYERSSRIFGSPEIDLLEEVVAGVREYFDKALGKVLLYRFEREQFSEVRRLWEPDENSSVDAKSDKYHGPGDVYGAEHLLRLFVSMPELIAQTNMDQQAINRLREELTKLMAWLGKNSATYFRDQYEEASLEYIERAGKGF